MSRLAIAFLLVTVTRTALAQLPTGTILGVVHDQTGATLPGAEVTITNVNTGLVRTSATSEDGSYRVPALPVGTYKVTVGLAGFKTVERSGLTLEVGQEAVVNVSLEVGSTGETVEVTAAPEEINTTNATVGALVNEQKVQDLPLNGRNFVALTLLQPGVQQGNPTATTGGTYFTVNGAPIRSNAMLLDGAVMNMMYAAQVTYVGGANLGVEGIREYRVLTNNFGPEYGMFMGSITTIVSKSGSNQYHGSGFEYLRNSVMDARNYFDPPSTLIGRRIPLYQRNQFGGSFGGPIKKDKTFFYGVYEQLKDNLNQPVILSVPVAACHTPDYIVDNQACLGLLTPGTTTVAPVIRPLLTTLYPLPNLPGRTNNFVWSSPIRTNERYGQVRVDHTFSASDSFFARFTTDNETKGSLQNYPSIHVDWEAINNYTTLSETHTFSPTVVNQARASFSHTGIRWQDKTQIKGPGFSFGSDPNVPVGNVSVTGLSTYNTANVPLWNKQNIYTLSDDVFWIRGRHSLKFGTLFNRYDDPLQSNYFQPGLMAFANLSSFLQGLPLQYQISTVDPGIAQNRNYRYYTAGFYAGDDYRVNSRLTLNLGLRYEFWTVPHDSNNRDFAFHDIVLGKPVLCTTPGAPDCVTQGPDIRNPSMKNFAPRVGFAWDVTGKGTTSLRSGFGIFYDIASIQSVYQWSSVGMPPLAGVNTVGPCVPFCASPPLTVPLTIPPGSKSSAVQTVDYYANQPYMMQWNLSIERQLPGNFILTTGYVGTRGIHLWQSREANPVLPSAITNGIPSWNAGVLGPQQAAGCLSIVPTCRRNPNLGSNTQINSLGESFYNGLQVGINKRLSHGIQIQANYVWSKALDDSQGILADSSGGGQISEPFFTKKFDWAPSPFDIKHNLRINVLYRIPNVKSTSAVAQLAKNWWLGSIVAAQSGPPFSPLLNYASCLCGISTDRADPVTEANLAQALVTNPNAVVYNKDTVIIGRPRQWYNPNMFTQPSLGRHGLMGRNVLRGPGLTNWDLSVNKDTPIHKLGETVNLQFRAEIFNVLNHPNFSVPSATVLTQTGINPTAGLISATTTPARQVQLALKVVF